MAKTALNIIKNWFKTGLFPTEAQFHAWMDSFWHKDEDIPVEQLAGVQEILDQKVDKVSGKELSTNDFTAEEKTKLASLQKSGVFLPGAQTTEDANGKIVQTISTYTSGETRETRIAYSETDVSKIEMKDSLLQVATSATFDNGLPEPTATATPEYSAFEFSIELP